MRQTSVLAVMMVATLVLPSAAAQNPRDDTAPPIRPTGTARISGVVLSSDEPGTPVRLARVTLNSLDRGGAADTATTDASGRFTFRALPSGRYAIQSTKRAWLDSNYGASRLGRSGTPVAVRDGEQLAGLTIRMTRGAVITGVVRDPGGEPQPGVIVRVMQFVTRDGARALERPVSMNPSDPITQDDGAYRAYGLPPGDYIVVAALRLSNSGGLGGEEARVTQPGEVDRALAAGARALTGANANERPTGPSVTNAPVYFPGTPDLSGATTITLAAGEERTGIDIPFVMFPTARVTGTLSLGNSNLEGSGITIDRRAECRMTPAGFEELLKDPIGAAVARIGPDWKLVFPGVPPGRFTIVCAAGANSNQGTGPRLLGWAETSIVVNGQDQDIAMTFGPASMLTGRVLFEGAAPPKDAVPEVQITARGFGKARLLRSDFDTRPRADGTINFEAIVPGRWLFGANLPAQSKWAVKSVTIGGREIDSMIEIAAGEVLGALVVTLTDQPSELTGALQDASGRPASEYFVIAFPTNRGAWKPGSRRIQSSRPGSDGVYSIKGLPAGEYYLAALTDVEPGEWFSPAFLDQIVPASVRVKIADGVKTTQSLQISR